MLSKNEPLQVNLAGLEASSDRNRRRVRELIALLLLVALILVAVRYREFWFGSLSFQNAAEQTTSEKVKENQRNVNPTAPRKSSSSGKQHPPSLSEAAMAAESSVPEVVSAPLQVDVTYPGGRHETLLARDSSIHLDLQHDPRQSATASPIDAGSGVVNAAERVSHSLQRTEAVVVRPVDAIYHLPAQQLKVKGSVVLQAQIGKDGSVQSLQVVSGPDILASAALEAVRQWRFKPTDAAGQAVPAETRITVNFIISTP
jgi:TonB family protein